MIDAEDLLQRFVSYAKLDTQADPASRSTPSSEKQYRNMRYGLEKDMRPVELALEAMRRAGLEPVSTAIRGGTDGSRRPSAACPHQTSSPASTTSTASWRG